MDWGECSVKLFRLTKENQKERESSCVQLIKATYCACRLHNANPKLSLLFWLGRSRKTGSIVPLKFHILSLPETGSPSFLFPLCLTVYLSLVSSDNLIRTRGCGYCTVSLLVVRSPVWAITETVPPSFQFSSHLLVLQILLRHKQRHPASINTITMFTVCKIDNQD